MLDDTLFVEPGLAIQIVADVHWFVRVEVAQANTVFSDRLVHIREISFAEG